MNKLLGKTAVGAGGMGLGAALMYLLDPERGKRRRSLLRDKFVHAAHATGEKLDVRSRDTINRVRGVAARTRSLVRKETVSDKVLAERVKSKIGHIVSRPGSIEVSVRNGRVTLAGPALTREVEPLVGEVSRVQGVSGVENKLELHEESGGVQALQG